MSFALLGDMISRGNRVAQFRKSEIELLEELVEPLTRPSTPASHPNDEAQLVTPQSEEQIRDPQTLGELEVQSASLLTPSVHPVPVTDEEDLLFDWRDFGVSLNQMLSATDELNTNEVYNTEQGDLSELWLWSDV